MTTPSQAPAEPVTAILTARGTLPRGLAVIAGLAGAVLPVLSATGFGMTQSTGLVQAAALPVLAALALAAPGIAAVRAYSRLLDIVALAAGVLLLAYVGYLYLDARNQMATLPGLSAMGQSVTFQPALGLWAIAAASAGMAAACFWAHRR